MNGASKILTVSYGTFSCTLEGFDDPFNTMKAIAEYFRDLAAGDRYFGAEPPTPDAAMLHQIAEREIQRRVEAKIQDNGVVLRASDQPEAAPMSATPSQLSAPIVAEVPAPAVAEQPPVQTPVQTPVHTTVQPSVAPASAPATESVVEKLSRLRSEIAAQPAAIAPAQTVPVVSFAIPDYLEDQDAETLEAAALVDFLPEDLASDGGASDDVMDLPEDAPEEAPVDEMLTEAPMGAKVDDYEEEPADLVAELPEIDFSAVMAEAEPVAVEDASETDGIDLASVMDAVEATVDAPAEETVVAEELPVVVAEAEPDHGDDLPESLIAALSHETDAVAEAVQDAEYEVEADIWAEAAAEDVATQAHAAAGDDSLIASLDAVMNAAPEAEPVVDTATEEAIAEEESVWAETWAETTEAPTEEPVEAVVQPVVAADPEDEALRAAMIADEVAVEPGANEQVAGGQVAGGPAAVAEDTTGGMELRPGSAEKLQRARARVIRIRRNEEPAAPAADPAADPVAAVVAEPEATVEDAPISAAAFAEVEEAAAFAQPPLLSAEDEAELQRELAALRRGEADQDADVMASLSHLTQQPDSRRGFDGPSADEALSRLMKQTDNEMEGSETKRRQSAIQHLKAAVAATVADRKVTGEKAGETETVSRLARYRNDLAMAVKAALPGGRSATAGDRPAPLVLVSEQRIDRPRQSGTPSASVAPAPIRPRRVTSAGLGMAAATDLDLSDDEEDDDDLSNVFGDSKGFAEFVEKIGASSFEQILEASAAYLAGVEGRPHFSRPQLMRHLTEVIPQGTFQREDGLRSFGTLLRDGRIAKVRRGQFMLSEESTYLAEARKIAQ
jgi:hypothetical protein